MDAPRVSYLRLARPLDGGRWSLAPLALALLVALGFFVSVALPYLLLDPSVLARYGSRRVWLVTHVAAGAVALLTGPVQLWLGVSGRAVRVHRRLGLAYNASLRSFFDWTGFGTAYAETANAREHEAIVGMVQRHEGRESASIARYWLTRQPEAFRAVRQVDGRLLGFVANLRLEAATPEDASADPAIARAIEYADRHGPPRHGESIQYGRFWMDADRHQAITQVFTVAAAICSQSWIAPRVAWSFVAMADPDLMEPMFTEIQMRRLRDADFDVDGRRYGVFGHDWRVEPADGWLRLKAERALRIEGAITPETPCPPFTARSRFTA